MTTTSLRATRAGAIGAPNAASSRARRRLAGRSLPDRARARFYSGFIGRTTSGHQSASLGARGADIICPDYLGPCVNLAAAPPDRRRRAMFFAVSVLASRRRLLRITGAWRPTATGRKGGQRRSKEGGHLPVRARCLSEPPRAPLFIRRRWLSISPALLPRPRACQGQSGRRRRSLEAQRFVNKRMRCGLGALVAGQPRPPRKREEPE